MIIESMTGFSSEERGDFRIEVRSVNHKNIDINFNAPSYLYSLDLEIRKSIRKLFNRGRIDIYVSRSKDAGKKIKVNKYLAKEYHRAFVSLRNELKIKAPVSIELIASQKDIFTPDDSGLNISEFKRSLDAALRRLKISRKTEGRKLVLDIKKRLAIISKQLAKIRNRRKIFISKARANLYNRLKEILKDVMLDETRLVQELAILIERSDITEEIVRIKSHLDYMKDILISGDTVGKKLDFVIQELRREVNTIGSKSSDIEITVAVVEMKDELEKVREQVQNLQ